MTKKEVQELNRKESDLLLAGDFEKLQEIISRKENTLIKDVYCEMLRKN